MGYVLNNFEKKTAHSLTRDTFISLMDGRLNELIGVGLLRGTCGLLDTADSAGRDLGDALLACEYHANWLHTSTISWQQIVYELAIIPIICRAWT